LKKGGKVKIHLTKKALLIILFISIIGITFYLSVIKQLDWISILINIISEIIGIIITVFYIDDALSRQEEKRWENVKYEINRKTKLFALKTLHDLSEMLSLREKISWNIERIKRSKGVSTYTYSLKVDPSILESSYHSNPYYESIKKNLPNVEDIKNLKDDIHDGYKIMDLFREQLSPDLYVHLMQTLEKLDELEVFLKYNLEDITNKVNRTGDKTFLEPIADKFKDSIVSVINLFNITTYYVSTEDYDY
jgi:predicted MPP superfamily phosphohydrolase